jgi:hypothetical protein
MPEHAGLTSAIGTVLLRHADTLPSQDVPPDSSGVANRCFDRPASVSLQQSRERQLPVPSKLPRNTGKRSTPAAATNAGLRFNG